MIRILLNRWTYHFFRTWKIKADDVPSSIVKELDGVIYMRNKKRNEYLKVGRLFYFMFIYNRIVWWQLVPRWKKWNKDKYILWFIYVVTPLICSYHLQGRRKYVNKKRQMYDVILPFVYFMLLPANNIRRCFPCNPVNLNFQRRVMPICLTRFLMLQIRMM